MMLVLRRGIALFSLIAILGAVPGTSLAQPGGGDAPTSGDTVDGFVTVVADGASARINQQPFRIDFLDAAGTVRLAQLDAPADPVPLSVRPGILGITDAVPDTSRYAAFTFEVGGGTNVEFPGAPWGGNLLLGGSSGQQYVTTDVTSVTSEADGGVQVTVATDDPAGREVIVRVAPDQAGLVQVSARVTPDDGVSALAAAFATPPDEAFHGFGGRHNALDQRGNSFPSWTQQENFGTASAQPVADASAGAPGNTDGGFLFPNGETAAYYVQAQFISSVGYGFLLDRYEFARFDVASSRDDAWRVSVAGAETDFVVAPGEPATAIQALTAITGRQRVPPQWAIEPAQYRGVRVLSAEADTPEGYAAAVRDDLAEIDRTGIPFGSYTIEGWDFIERDVLAELIAEIKSRDIKVMMYIRAFVGRDVANTEDPTLFDDAVSRGLVATTPGGAPYLFGSPFIVGVGALLDFTNPETQVYWDGRIREMLDLGADGFMQDFGEQVMTNMQFHDGSTGAEMHNRFTSDYHRLTRETFDAYALEHPDRELFFFTRTGYSGRPGTTAYENANFPGDETTDFSRASGLGSLITDMLSRGIGGAVGFTTDIGGYADYLSGSPTKELYIRWSQATALMPFMRNHNSSSTGHRTPWSYDEETVATFRHHAELHLAAQPLIAALWEQSTRTGMPVTQPLWLVFPDDPVAGVQDQQFMLGPDVLVAPVVTDGARARDVYFPDARTGLGMTPNATQENCWFHPETGERFAGAQTTTVDAPIDRLPYFFRCGTQPFPVTLAAGAPSVGTPQPSPTTPAAPAATAAQTGTSQRLPATGANGQMLGALTLLLAAAVLRPRRRNRGSAAR